MTSRDDARRLARHLLVIADDLDERGYRLTGTNRQAARVLLELAELVPDAGACPVCGAPVLQPSTGRRRVYCSDRCKRRARNATERAS